MSAKPTQPDPPKKRAPAKPSDETLALRAVRELRRLRERADVALKTYQTTRNECLKATIALEASLSPGVKALVDKLMPAAETANGEAE